MTSTPRTLIADDQPDVLEALRLLLKSEGYQIEAVNSPGAVLDKLQRDQFDVLLMDLNYTRDTTSGQEGLDLLSRIQAIDETLPVVAMTAWGSVDLAVEAMRRGVRDFVLKPWDNSRLLTTLRSRIAEGQSKRHELEREREEFEEARAIGQALLPKTIPQAPGLEISTTTQPYRSLSGDYFDVIELGEGTLAISIADVIGKGVPAALLMSNVQASVRLLAGGRTAPAELAEKLNRSVARNTTPGKFVTFFYCVADMNAKKLAYTNAGHCAPVLLRASGEVVRLAAGGAVLGVLPDWQYEQAEVALESGDRLILFTDGLTEAANATEEEFGEERLVELAAALRDRGAHELKNRILQTVSSFTGGRAQDDVTLLVAALA
ncbi:MAG TPA: SpoIIE family protein phosphatase [Bryobacteraceae bacterium]|nr:SpoIIE family protein phosphatase [Bryobacteraceae bacterium]